MNGCAFHDKENHLNRERRNWTSSFPERVNPALVRPTIDHARTVGECNSPIGWGSPSRVPQELASQSQLGCLCATIEPRVHLPPHPSTGARHIVARARACRRVHIHTYVRRGGTCPHVRTSETNRTRAGVAPWRVFVHVYTLKRTVRSQEEKDEGEKGRKAERRLSRGTRGNETGDPCVARCRRRAASVRRRILTHARNTGVHTHGRTRPSKPHATTPSQSDVGSGPTIHPDDTLSLLHTDVSHGYATRLYGGPRRKGDTRWD